MGWKPPFTRDAFCRCRETAEISVQGGISTADRIVTVSPGYAWEIQTPEGGWGMEKMLTSRAYALNGVLNGIDTEEWNPSTDKHIVKNYSISNFSRGKVGTVSVVHDKALAYHSRSILHRMQTCIPFGQRAKAYHAHFLLLFCFSAHPPSRAHSGMCLFLKRLCSFSAAGC